MPDAARSEGGELLVPSREFMGAPVAGGAGEQGAATCTGGASSSAYRAEEDRPPAPGPARSGVRGEPARAVRAASPESVPVMRSSSSMSAAGRMCCRRPPRRTADRACAALNGSAQEQESVPLVHDDTAFPSGAENRTRHAGPLQSRDSSSTRSSRPNNRWESAAMLPGLQVERVTVRGARVLPAEQPGPLPELVADGLARHGQVPGQLALHEVGRTSAVVAEELLCQTGRPLLARVEGGVRGDLQLQVACRLSTITVQARIIWASR
ncbi:hypothetical protein SCALM49S_04261 [Streptomyces californicus]